MKPTILFHPTAQGLSFGGGGGLQGGLNVRHFSCPLPHRGRMSESTGQVSGQTHSQGLLLPEAVDTIRDFPARIPGDSGETSWGGQTPSPVHG